ncbi:MAG: ribosome biogenesis GTPase Der [Betaproteobacteria bacterium RIFCSPLOWO2_02_FULL_64_12]|nr:MAG: ribosome biogenesis GTPase Der [Betaproteobacteria bacterium RIFCSPLOWO2_02_FULL_64_12]
MKPTIVLVGRPNVGKSTLFNRLTRSREALVADFPGLTRDRHYGVGRMGDKPYLVLDTGGLEPGAKEGVFAAMAKQTRGAIAEADAVIFLTDAREGLTAQDRRIAEELRRVGRPVWLAVNKCEGLDPAVAAAEFHELGLGSPRAVSAAHGEGVRDLIDAALARFSAAEEETPLPKHPHIAIVGRPNAGKSTLVNCIVGEDRLIVQDEPGTTRDAIDVEISRGGRRYTLIDTAGLRRRGRVFETIEKFSVVKTLQAIDRANVVILVLDAESGVAEQDAHIAGFILERGRALVVAVNKWDAADAYQRDLVKRSVERNLGFLSFARTHYISGLRGDGIAALFRSVDQAYRAATAKLATPKLTRALARAVERQAPPRRGLVRPKPRYAHQGGVNPPVVVIHGNALQGVPDTYRRYLEGFFRKEFELEGTPLRIEFRSGRNPYAEKVTK